MLYTIPMAPETEIQEIQARISELPALCVYLTDGYWQSWGRGKSLSCLRFEGHYFDWVFDKYAVNHKLNDTHV